MTSLSFRSDNFVNFELFCIKKLFSMKQRDIILNDPSNEIVNLFLLWNFLSKGPYKIKKKLFIKGERRLTPKNPKLRSYL